MNPATAEAPHDPSQGALLSVRLREETREAHERVETTAAFNRLVVVRLGALAENAPARDHARLAQARIEYREVYRRFLVASHGFESAVDAALAASPVRALAGSLGYAPEASSPTALILDDLRRVFGDDAAEGLERMTALAPVRTLAGFVGTEYVRRGSRAGGAVVGAVVRQNLGLTRDSGASFLLQHGKETRALLTGFKHWIDGLALPEPGMRAATAAAIATFEAIQRWHAHLEARFG